MIEIKFQCIVAGNHGQVIRIFNEWLDGDGWKHDYYAPLVTNGIFNHEELGDGWMGDIIRRQYAGLKDRSGEDIYEGDILLEEAPRGNRYKIWREEGGLVINSFTDDFSKDISKINFWSGLSDMQTIGFVKGTLAVIGNIYENPELLTKKPA